MGCDIHILYQVYDPVTKEWLLVKDHTIAVPNDQIPQLYHQGKAESTTMTSESHNSTVVEEFTEEDYDIYYEALDHFWGNIDRDYLLFAKLAGVRNEYGLLNIHTPRGFPEGLDTRVKELYDDPNFHSHTWLLDAEIEHLDMEELPVTMGSHFIHAAAYEKAKKANPRVKFAWDTIYLYINMKKDEFQFVTGFIYPQAVWDGFDDARKQRELSRPGDFENQSAKGDFDSQSAKGGYGSDRNMVYVQFDALQKKRCRSYPDLMDDLQKIKRAFLEQKVRALICFDN